MIICKYKDGSSIRVYNTPEKREKASSLLTKMDYICWKMAHCPNHYSLKVIKPFSPVFDDWVNRVFDFY